MKSSATAMKSPGKSKAQAPPGEEPKQGYKK